MIIAHRGGSEKHIENNIKAFADCVESGIQGIEFDVHLTQRLP